MWAVVSIIASFGLSTTIAIDCGQLNSTLSQAQSQIAAEQNRSSTLQSAGYTYPDNVFGADPTYDTCAIAGGENARLHTVAAEIFISEDYGTLADFQSLVGQCNAYGSVPSGCNSSPNPLPKYRPIDGRGANPNNPEYGASDTPFARFAPAAYDDGISTLRKSVTGDDLPNVRDIVQNVLTQAVGVTPKDGPDDVAYSVFALMTVLFITHDVHYQTAVQPNNETNEISCCVSDNSSPLPEADLDQSCLPIEISSNDSFYSSGNIGCISMVRSQRTEYSNTANPGQPTNRASSYLDLSLIYGNHPSELAQIRSYVNGTFRMSPSGLLPADINGNYIPSMQRFTMVPMASVWPSLFAKNHNTLAKGLQELNPQWDDETLFQEARRINIATFQYNLITSGAVQDSISKIPINETYDPLKNAATTLEFSIAYRTPHYYIHDQMLFQAADNSTTYWNQSDTIGNIGILENDFDGAVRGAVNQIVNVGPYADEIINRIGKNSAGYGKDIISIDIQRARDQGLPSFLDVRKQCNFPPITSWENLTTLFNPINVQLLQNVYESVYDIDFYVGGVLEILEILGNPLVGPTLGCVIGSQWSNFAGGDIYYYLNPSSPYPFTQDQIAAVQKYSISNLLCANSNNTQTAEIWPYAPKDGVNPIVSCDIFPPMNLTAWKA